MHPRAAADVGDGLDSVPVSRWPHVAAEWLAAGWDSGELREVAAMGRADSDDVIRARMLAALDSIGFAVVTEEQLAARCQPMLDVVQRDLQRCGWPEYRFRPVNVVSGLAPILYAALPDGRCWSGGGAGMRAELGDPELLAAAAESVSDTLAEVEGLVWPRCARHGGRLVVPAVVAEPAQGGVVGGEGSMRSRVYWRCVPDAAPWSEIQHDGPEHYLQPVGELLPTDVVTRT